MSGKNRENNQESKDNAVKYYIGLVHHIYKKAIK